MYVKLLRSCWDDFAVCAGVLAGFFLGAHIITAVVLAFFSDGTSLMLSGTLLPIISAFLVVIYSISYSGFQFSHLVRFGCTRRRALALTLCLEAATALFCMVLSALFTGLERLAAPALWLAITGRQEVVYGLEGLLISEGSASPFAQSHALFVELFSLPLWGWFAIAVGAVAAGTLCGAILQRFGKKGMWVLWAMWMAVCFIPQVFDSYLQFLPDLTLVGGAGGVGALLAFCWSVWYLLRAPVPQ